MNDLYSFFYWGDYNAQMAELAKRHSQSRGLLEI